MGIRYCRPAGGLKSRLTIFCLYVYVYMYVCNVCICIIFCKCTYQSIFTYVSYLLSVNCSKELMFAILMYPTLNKVYCIVSRVCVCVCVFHCYVGSKLHQGLLSGAGVDSKNTLHRRHTEEVDSNHIHQVA